MSEAQAQSSVLVDRDGHVLIITLNRPEARNSVNLAVNLAVGEALEEAETDRNIRAVVITGAGDQAFCAGADLKALARGERIAPQDPERRAWGFAGYVSHHISKPMIAAVNGSALGGGTEIVLASDLAVAAEHATFGLPEVKRGIYAAAGGAFRITAQVPPKIGMELLLTGEPITAGRAHEVGLINAVARAGGVLDAALQLAGRISVNAPLAVQASKRIARGIVEGKVEDEVAAWRRSRREGAWLAQFEDTREGPRAFAEQRPPRWRGV
jgi:crotonobetainyl-CoA hydratase